MLMEGNFLYDVVDSESDLHKYKVVILPDNERITSVAKAKLDTYLQNGGKILASGKSGLYADKEEFAFDFGAEYVGESVYNPSYIRPLFDMEGLFETSYIMYSQAEVTKLTDGTMLAKQENPYFNRTAEHFCSAV